MITVVLSIRCQQDTKRVINEPFCRKAREIMNDPIYGCGFTLQATTVVE
jgi:hypothetical protein